MNRRRGTSVGVLLSLLGLPAILAAQDHPAKHSRYIPSLHGGGAPLVTGATSNCARLTTLIIPNTQITSAEVVPASDELPEFCHVLGVVSPAVVFEVGLPTDWNQKLYFGGNGGFAGSIPDTQGETSFGLISDTRPHPPTRATRVTP